MCVVVVVGRSCGPIDEGRGPLLRRVFRTPLSSWGAGFRGALPGGSSSGTALVDFPLFLRHPPLDLVLTRVKYINAAVHFISAFCGALYTKIHHVY